MTISLEQANIVTSAALMEGRKLALKPLSVAVLDAGGHLIAFARQDGASTLRPQIAMGKAGSALALGVSSRTIAQMATDRPTFIASMGSISPLGVIPAAGGVLIRDECDRVVGAIGVTGDTSDNDELCALAGIAAIDLVPDR
ncbi:GlcG/HbpS family heme-binding protein [Novosphingopyxis sp.]|uniref:GlcG/HbpS family heme-binding protein n=1 Tax=Novosphingopyxis sp. TaxID=2709690 RepID=UPI003B5C5928